MEAGRELDALIAENIMQEQPRITWELLSPDGHASAFTAETKKEVEDWQTYYNQKYPNSWMADYHIGTWKHYPRYSLDISAAWQVVEKLAVGMIQFRYENTGTGTIYAKFVDCAHNHLTWGDASTSVSHAICLAALQMLNISTN